MVKLDFKLRLLVEPDEETGRWSAVFPELPGCASAGDTEAEAVENAMEALKLWFEPSPIPASHRAKWVDLSVSRAANIQFSRQVKSSALCVATALA